METFLISIVTPKPDPGLGWGREVSRVSSTKLAASDLKGDSAIEGTTKLRAIRKERQ
jgi:hypothetical protein